MKFAIKFLLVILAPSIGLAQNKSVLTINSTAPVGLTEACKKIVFAPGFKSQLVNQKSIFRINKSLTCETDYSTTTDVPKPGDISVDKSLDVGSSNYATNVSENGQFTFQMPLFVPQGTNGMQPQLALSYMSQSFSGLLGTGFSLSGLSQISRTGKKKYLDDNMSAPSIYEDIFSIDGMRMLEYNNQGYYTTEAESFSKISIQKLNGIVSSFIVESKNGNITEYGTSVNSVLKSEISGTENIGISWMISKITDPLGNYIKFYYKIAGKNEILIDRIVYTGNDAAGLTPYGEIRFTYSTRQDRNTTFVSGTQVEQTVL